MVGSLMGHMSCSWSGWDNSYNWGTSGAGNKFVFLGLVVIISVISSCASGTKSKFIFE